MVCTVASVFEKDWKGELMNIKTLYYSTPVIGFNKTESFKSII